MTKTALRRRERCLRRRGGGRPAPAPVHIASKVRTREAKVRRRRDHRRAASTSISLSRSTRPSHWSTSPPDCPASSCQLFQGRLGPPAASAWTGPGGPFSRRPRRLRTRERHDFDRITEGPGGYGDREGHSVTVMKASHRFERATGPSAPLGSPAERWEDIKRARRDVRVTRWRLGP